MEGLEGDFEVYYIIGGGLDRVVVEDGVLVWLGGYILLGRGWRHTIARTLC